MRKYLYLVSILILVLIPSLTFTDDDNSNTWFPNSDIPNIHLVALYTFHGLPKNTEPDREIKILVNHSYAVGYSEELKGPLYAVYRYGNLQDRSENLVERSFERPSNFQIDLRTAARVGTDDYTGSGYDRGHVAQLRTENAA